MGSKRSDFGDGANPRKIFIGGLAKDTTLGTLVQYFGKYGEMIDSVIMPFHCGHCYCHQWQTIEIKRTIPKRSGGFKDLKTTKIFVDEFKSFFSKFGKVVEHDIIRDHVTKRSRGFEFIVVDNILTDGNMIDMSGTHVEIKKAQPNPPPGGWWSCK